MSTNRQWVALLTEDEDDFAYWQFGFKNWTNHLQVEWFATGDAFFERADLATAPPAVLLLDGLIPSNDEPHWLRRILEHECCQNLVVIMLSDQFTEEEQRQYKALGASAFMIKPESQLELETAVLFIRQFATVNL
ncbi:hypothetical protein [Spirosoma lituiforme]